MHEFAASREGFVLDKLVSCVECGLRFVNVTPMSCRRALNSGRLPAPAPTAISKSMAKVRLCALFHSWSKRTQPQILLLSEMSTKTGAFKMKLILLDRWGGLLCYDKMVKV